MLKEAYPNEDHAVSVGSTSQLTRLRFGTSTSLAISKLTYRSKAGDEM
jgi:hypothetical protein